ncbi:MAG: glycosyltransferase, partial [Actinomycetota bacterium]|nr:glycosyltransferase [Actinomycetota bacterium]
MIVKDEEGTLPECLASLNRVVDEVVMYDTGSKDHTVDLARTAGAKIIKGFWDDDFGRARNAALEHCRGDWILWVDADERFVCSDIPALRAALERLSSAGNLDAMLVDIYNLAGDGSVLGNVHRAFRLFRKETCRWYGALHEQVDLRPELVGPRVVQAAPLIGARIDHIGYTDDIVRERNKLERNLRLATAELKRTPRPGEEGIPEFNMARALSAAGRAEEAQAYYEKAMPLARKGVPFRAVLFHMVQNLALLGRYEDIARYSRILKDSSTDSAMADFFEAVALRRLGQLDDALALLRAVKALPPE